MRVELEQAGIDKKDMLRQLMNYYIYDFSTYLDFEIDEHTGMFAPYPNYDKLWEEEHNYTSYLFKVEARIAGFAIVETLGGKREAEYYMTEFFVLRKYRKLGVGKTAAIQLFNQYKGRWLISQISTNLPAQNFWRTIIGEYTNGKYAEESRFDNRQISQRFVSS